MHHFFDDAPQHDDHDFGRIARDDYWADSQPCIQAELRRP